MRVLTNHMPKITCLCWGGFSYYLVIYLFWWLVASFPPKAPRVSGNAPASSHQMLYMSDSSDAGNFSFSFCGM